MVIDRNRAPFDDAKRGADSYSEFEGHRRVPKRLGLVGDNAVSGTVGPEPAPSETDDWPRLRRAMAVALLPSLAFWALVSYALSYLISNRT